MAGLQRLLRRLFSSRNASEPEPRAMNARLTWFELQLCPFHFRLAILPGQRALIGFSPVEGSEDCTALMPYAGNEAAVDGLLAALDGAIRKNRIFETEQRTPEHAFAEAAMQTDSLHFRAAYSDNRRWAAVYPWDELPANVQALLEECQQLGRQTLQARELGPLAPEAALALAEPAEKAVAPSERGSVAKVKVTASGQIYLNGRAADRSDLREALMRLKEERGAVWYYRENPAGEPSEAAITVIKAIAEARLPIKLCEEDFDVSR